MTRMDWIFLVLFLVIMGIVGGIDYRSRPPEDPHVCYNQCLAFAGDPDDTTADTVEWFESCQRECEAQLQYEK